MSKFGPWAERLDAIATGRELVAVGGRRDALGVTTSLVHVMPTSMLDGKGAVGALDPGAPVTALAFAGDDLLLSGGADGRLIAWDVTGKHAVAQLALGAAVRSIALDADVARGGAGALAVGTSDGALHVLAFAVQGGKPTFATSAKHTLSDGAIDAVTRDPAGLWLAGAADGQLWVVGAGAAAPRAIAPGGDGGIRAIASVGDGRAVLGCGDGSLRVCFVVGDVEPHDRSGDHGHQGALRGIVLGPSIVDAAGREQPRRVFTVGEDGALKVWFLEGARRPKTVELGLGPLGAIAFAPGPVAKLEGAAGRLWIASANRQVAAISVSGDIELAGDPVSFASVFSAYRAQLSESKVAVKVKLEAVAALATFAEDEARGLLDLALASGPSEVRVAAAAMMVASHRRASRPALREALGTSVAEVRIAAFNALVALEREQPLVAVRAGLASPHEDIQVRAVAALVPLAPVSVIAQGMIADALRHANPNVRNHAYAALRQTATSPLEAIRTALARGSADLRARALLDLGFVIHASDAPARALASRAFDDEDAGVRASAFMAAIAMRTELAGRLVALVPTVRAFWERVAIDFPKAIAPPVDSGRTSTTTSWSRCSRSSRAGTPTRRSAVRGACSRSVIRVRWARCCS